MTLKEIGKSVGVDYVQSTEPSSPLDGETWYDTETRRLRVYADVGNGSNWQSITPVEVLSEVTSFNESDITVHNTSTQIVNGSVELRNQITVDNFNDGNTTIEEGIWNGWTGDTGNFSASSNEGSLTNGRGTRRVYANRATPTVSPLKFDLEGTHARYDENYYDVRIHSGGTRIGIIRLETEKNMKWYDGSWKTLRNSWNYNTSYSFELTWDWDNNQVNIHDGFTNHGTFNLENSANGFDEIELMCKSAYSDNVEMIVDNIIESDPPTTGSVLIEWANPIDIESWDLVTFQRTLDNESVTVDVEDENGNVLFSDIGQNFNISTIPNNTNIRVRATLSRSNTSNNPKLDYVARRYVR